MRRVVLGLTLLLFAVPLQAQKGKQKRDPYKIVVEELAEYGDQNMMEVMRRARPNLLMFNGGSNAMMGEQTLSGAETGLIVYVGTQLQGDTSVLRFYKASDVKEVRYYKPTNAGSPNTRGDAFVLQLLMKDAKGQ